MEYMSPLLKARIQNSANNKNSNNTYVSRPDNEKLYETLQQHANDVKPNEAKAKLIKQGPISGFFSSIKDTFQDAKNFSTAVKTGKLGDNNLGRLNDLGMKAGALLIATFLASNAKTKTEAISKFIGGTTFFASMALWPKLFINLPARLVHGFNIGQRYISAQGDKKDFFLDNQFLPWDAYSPEEIAKIGKRTGIDINSKNGKAKIERKMQKTALQNRTLWMATAGFATPLLTAVFGDYITPKVEKAVIDHDYKKVCKIISDPKGALKTHFDYASDDIRNVKALDALFEEYKGKNLDDDFYKTLADMLGINAPEYEVKDGKLVRDSAGAFVSKTKEMFKNPDDEKPIKLLNNNPETFRNTLKNMAEKAPSVIGKEKLKENIINKLKELQESNPEDQLKEIMEKIGEDLSKEHIESVLENYQAGIFSESLDSILESSKEEAAIDNTEFFNQIKDFNQNTLGQIRGRIKAFANLLNPINGEKSESLYTQEYMGTVDKLISNLDLPYKAKEGISLTSLNKGAEQETYNALVEYFERRINAISSRLESKQESGILQSAEYKQLLEDLVTPTKIEFAKNGKETPLQTLMSNIDIIIPGGKNTTLSKALIGEGDAPGTISQIINKFTREQDANIQSIKAMPLICANFEARLKAGLIKMDEKEIGIARKILYNGGDSTRITMAGAETEKQYHDILDAIFNPDALKNEEQYLPGIGEIAQRIKDINPKSEHTTEEYFNACDLAHTIKNRMTTLYNNKSWKRIFIPMTIALIAITLLAQPFFGKIKKEFPEDKEGGAK